MKISILIYNLSNNCIVRTYPIAKVLEKYYEIEVIGPTFGNGIYEPYRHEFHYKVHPFKVDCNKISRIVSGLRTIREVIRSIEGDIIYAFKPRFTSFGIGLLAKYLKKIPLILDIEDWDAEPYHSSSLAKRLCLLRYLTNPDNDLYNRLLEPLTKLADEITVVSDFLQNRYGGTKLPHGADCSYFDPAKYDRESLRKKWGFNDYDKLILFAGKPLPHKGLEEVIQCLKIIGSNSIRLVTVGTETDYGEKLKGLAGDLMISIGPQPHSSMPEFLQLADLVILPQRKTAYAEAQVPGKVFEAMAMAKPIIATQVSDMPEILENCGILIQPNRPEAMAEAVQLLLSNPQMAEELGKKARQKCIKHYSLEAMTEIITPIVHKVAQKQRVQKKWTVR